jgi:hypothetical protein
MARTKSSLESLNTSNNEEERKSSKIKKMATVCIAAAGVSAAAVFNMAPANADEIVGFGGMGDPSGLAYGEMLRATGQLGPNDTYHPVPYPASIWPLGPVTLEQSVNEGIVNGRNVLAEAQRAAAPGEKVVIRGYSEGGIPGAALANERSGGGPVEQGTAIFDGTPVSDMGMFNPQDPFVQSILPMATNMMGVPTHYRAPAGSIVRSSEQDVWAMGGPSDLGKLIGQAMDTFMGPAHAVQDERGFHYVVVGADGIEHHIFPGTGTGGVAPGVGMGGPAPAPSEVAPAPLAPPAPLNYNFTSHIHEEPAVPQRSVPESHPSVQRTERAVTLHNGTFKDGTPKKTVVRGSVSIVAKPHTK